jgi:hypothetical protein
MGRKRLVLATAAIFCVLCVAGFSLAGSYALTLHAISVAQHAQAAAATRNAVLAKAAALKAAVPTCQALLHLDQARAGAIFAGRARTGVPLALSYGHRLAVAIHQVYLATRCATVLKDAAGH